MRIRLEKINLAEFVWRKKHGISAAPRVIGYTDGKKQVRTVGFGALGLPLPPVVSRGREDRKDPSQRPAKHAAGFAEKHLPNVIRKAS